MGTTRETITVTDHQDELINTQIEGGDFTNDNEHIRDLIRRYQARNSAIDAIRGELIKGKQSSEPQPLDGYFFFEEISRQAYQQSLLNIG